MPVNRTGTPASAQAGLHAALDQLRAVVEHLRASGAESLPRRATAALRPGPRPNLPAGVTDPVPAAAPPVAVATPVAADRFTAPRLQAAGTLEALRTELGDCQRCKLSGGRTHIVFGVGNPCATLMFVGEGPGRDEDLRGEPFVGRAGQLLTEIITKGMKMRREDVYIANVIKCRPPENRNPEPDEIAACQPFLRRQIELVRPHVLVALGTFAAQTLLGVRTPISRLRGHWHEYQGVKLMPTLHPAYLLRNPNDKRLVWEDVKMVLRELGHLA